MKILKNKKIVKKEFLRALEKSDEVISEANRMADQIIDEARAEAEHIKLNAQKEGLEQGKAEAAGIVYSAKIQKEKMHKDLEHEIIDLAVETASSIIRKSRELDPEIVAETYHKVLALTESAEKIKLRVSPGDYETATSLLVAGEGGRQISRQLQIVKDETISVGGCIVESEMGTIDARLETQLEAIRKAFIQKTSPMDRDDR